MAAGAAPLQQIRVSRSVMPMAGHTAPVIRDCIGIHR
jgi:hypothetical protein